MIAGYATMFVLVVVTFSGAYLAPGADVTFRPGSYEPSALWLGMSFVLASPPP